MADEAGLIEKIGFEGILGIFEMIAEIAKQKNSATVPVAMVANEAAQTYQMGKGRVQETIRMFQTLSLLEVDERMRNIQVTQGMMEGYTQGNYKQLLYDLLLQSGWLSPAEGNAPAPSQETLAEETQPSEIAEITLSNSHAPPDLNADTVIGLSQSDVTPVQDWSESSAPDAESETEPEETETVSTRDAPLENLSTPEVAGAMQLPYGADDNSAIGSTSPDAVELDVAPIQPDSSVRPSRGWGKGQAVPSLKTEPPAEPPPESTESTESTVAETAEPANGEQTLPVPPAKRPPYGRGVRRFNSLAASDSTEDVAVEPASKEPPEPPPTAENLTPVAPTAAPKWGSGHATPKPPPSNPTPPEKPERATWGKREQPVVPTSPVARPPGGTEKPERATWGRREQSADPVEPQVDPKPQRSRWGTRTTDDSAKANSARPSSPAEQARLKAGTRSEGLKPPPKPGEHAAAQADALGTTPAWRKTGTRGPKAGFGTKAARADEDASVGAIDPELLTQMLAGLKPDLMLDLPTLYALVDTLSDRASRLRDSDLIDQKGVKIDLLELLDEVRKRIRDDDEE